MALILLGSVFVAAVIAFGVASGIQLAKGPQTSTAKNSKGIGPWKVLRAILIGVVIYMVGLYAFSFYISR